MGVIRYKKTFLLILLVLLFTKVDYVFSQPVITPNRQPIILTLDTTGFAAIILKDLATVTSNVTNNPQVSIIPATFNCTDIGSRTVTIIAQDASGSSTIQIPVTVRNSLVIIYPQDTFLVPIYGNCISSVPDFSKITKLNKNCAAGVVFKQSVFAGTTLTDYNSLNVVLTATDEFGDTTSKVIRVKTINTPVPLHSVSIVTQDSLICSGRPATFLTKVKRNLSFGFDIQWLVNNVPVKNGNQTSLTTSDLKDGDRVSCTISGACSPLNIPSDNTISIKVLPSLINSVTISSLQKTNCPGDSFIFSATTEGSNKNLQYQWQVNAKNIPETGLTFINNNLKDGDIVTCIVTDTLASCLVNRTITSNPIIVNIGKIIAPSIVITPATASSCSGNPVTFTAVAKNEGNNPVFQWLVNRKNAGTNTPSFTYFSPNDGDLVSCTLTNPQSCSFPATSNISPISLFAVPSIVMVHELHIKYGSSVVLNPNIIGGQIKSNEWTPSIGLNNAFIRNPVVSPLVSTLYKFHVITTTGCEAIDSVFVKVENSPLNIPNTFTPNGDGINDTWVIKELNNYPNITVKIFSRYGLLLFYSQGYGKAWDGTYKGQSLPVGTYYYIIDLKTFGKLCSGSVTIIK